MTAYGFNTDTNTGRTIVCPTCGLRYPASARFCGQDGTILSGLASSTGQFVAEGPKVCPSCKTVYPSYAQFCPADASHLQPSFISQPQSQTSNNNQNQPQGQASPPQDQASNNQSQPQGQTSSSQIADSQKATIDKGQALAQSSQAHETGFVDGDHTRAVDRKSIADAETAAELEAGLGSGDSIFQETRIIGRTIAGKYRVENLLGEGGMAQVFRATHLGLDRTVVIKLMHSSMPSMDTAMKRFEQECKVTARLDHPNIVTVFDVGTLEGRRPYLVMEYIQGESMRDYLERESSMTIEDASNAIMQVCSGLAEAHGQGIVHRDLKPENIMLKERPDRPDWVKIVDFGIAHLKQGGQRLTRTGIAIGTVDYMSPEYLSDKPIDHRSDIYALGVILYEVIAGRCPFLAETAEAVMAKHLWGTPMPLSHFRPDLEPGCLFDQLAEKALHKEPDDRFQSVSEMRDDILRALKEYQSQEKASQ